ncbi:MULTISPECIES: putative polyvalent protein kinase domain-containing protein [Epilithonimonas]|uniref:Uncharacterized protein n=1 Tax=Epilithonimonas hominis TaxID=420404 RepID=A0A1H6LUA3_9FLAO|nr:MULTISPECIES: hypothetical protein [Epilithonimonas]SEH89075.1 hypothetical protein SAMN05421793_14617 [Epilithonimonas hominis]
MKNIKNELQNIITGNGQIGDKNLIKTIQDVLRRNEKSIQISSQNKLVKSEEEIFLKNIIEAEDLTYKEEISESNYISEGAEQKVYRLDHKYIIKLNDTIFYASWKDYFNSLLIHNYFFNSTKYELLGFKIINKKIFAVVKQRFVKADETVDLEQVKSFLEFNNFRNVRNNDYQNDELGLIFEDLHDENVLINNGILYFIDTIFYLTDNFYK